LAGSEESCLDPQPPVSELVLRVLPTATLQKRSAGKLTQLRNCKRHPMGESVWTADWIIDFAVFAKKGRNRQKKKCSLTRRTVFGLQKTSYHVDQTSGDQQD